MSWCHQVGPIRPKKRRRVPLGEENDREFQGFSKKSRIILMGCETNMFGLHLIWNL
jgi:hypothetical protein